MTSSASGALVATDCAADWRTQAACRGVSEIDFYSPEDVERARAVCADCVVRTSCLDYALATKEPYGVWGGLDEDERRILLRRRSAARRARSAVTPVAGSLLAAPPNPGAERVRPPRRRRSHVAPVLDADALARSERLTLARTAARRVVVRDGVAPR